MTNLQDVRRILVVDDQQQIHDTFSRIFSENRSDNEALSDFESRFLRDLGDDCAENPKHTDELDPTYVLEHAHSGEQGIDFVEASVVSDRRYSLAFVDMRMPQGLDGMETTERLWQIDPSLHVVICTAYSDHVWEDVLGRLGHSDRLLLLKKPFESDEARQLALALSEKSRLATIQEKKVLDLGREVERRRRAEETMRVMAHRDALTKLPNRPYLIDKLSKIVPKREVIRKPENAVLFLDLDNFKIINDSLGHNAGDDLLNQVAARLKQCVREQDTTGRVSEAGETVRLGGDEFVVLLEQLDDPQDALAVADRIVSRISEPFRLSDRLVNIGTSVGVAYIDDHVADAHEALRNADTAMYRAKNCGKGRVAIFDQTMHEDVVARMEMEDQLRRAITNESFALNYQPIINLAKGTVQGVEVLIRWTSESGKNVSPSEFVPMIEEIGMIGRVGEWVLENAMRDFIELTKLDLDLFEDDMYLGVNVSQRQLSDPFFVDHLETIIQKADFNRRRLKLEMNESINSRDGEQALDNMLCLHDSGVGIQIDDFGKGQSSLTCFQAYPIEAVKIDRSFTASIASDHSHSVIAQAIVQLAHHLNARIVAEGVESEVQLQSLRHWGCDSAQGYLFAAPMKMDSLVGLLRDPDQSEGIRLLRRKGQPTIPSVTPTPPPIVNPHAAEL
ncbi:MAG: EAL domain-containing protein [Rubripirellula sp.]